MERLTESIKLPNGDAVPVDNLSVPDLWHVAHTFPDDSPQRKSILQTWHLAHDLLNNIRGDESKPKEKTITDWIHLAVESFLTLTQAIHRTELPDQEDKFRTKVKEDLARGRSPSDDDFHDFVHIISDALKEDVGLECERNALRKIRELLGDTS